MKINFKSQACFFLTFCIFVTLVDFLMSFAMQIVYIIVGHSELIIIKSTFTFAVINTFRIFFSSQLVIACLTVQHRFKVFNQGFKESFWRSIFKIVKTRDTNVRQFGIIYHGLCDGIEIINSALTSNFLLIFPNLIVSSQFLR